MYSKMLGALHAKNWDWFYSFICVHGTQMTALWHWWRSRLEWPNIFILDDWRRLCVLPHLLQPISSTNTKRRRAPSTHESIRKKAMKFSNYWLMGLSIFHWCPISMNAKSPVSGHYRSSIHLSSPKIHVRSDPQLESYLANSCPFELKKYHRQFSLKIWLLLKRLGAFSFNLSDHHSIDSIYLIRFG